MTSTVTTLDARFDPGRRYRIGELRACINEVTLARRADPQMSAKMRTPKRTQFPWAKSWHEELLPLSFFADHMKLSDDDTFIWTPDEDADFEIRTAAETFRIQCTMAYPEWSVQPRVSGGYVRHREQEHLNAHGFCYGGGRVSEPRARSPEEELRAWRAGVKKALTSKLRQRGDECRLLIFAEGCRFDTIDTDFAEVVRPGVDDVSSAAWSKSFGAIYVLDQSAFLEVRP